MTTKEKIIQALYTHVAKRSGMDYRNYGNRESFNGDYRPMLRDGATARRMLAYVAVRPSITAERIIAASRSAFSGRLEIVVKSETVQVSYCAGQYFATEYRKAVCAVLARCIREWFDDSDIQKSARREFGRSIAKQWFS